MMRCRLARGNASTPPWRSVGAARRLPTRSAWRDGTDRPATHDFLTPTRMARRRACRVAAGSLGAALVVAACGNGGSTSPSRPGNDRQAIVAMMQHAAAALLAGQAKDACSLLTEHARRRVLGFRVDYNHEGAIPADDPRLPQTCEAVLTRERKTARESGGAISWPRDLRRARFVVRDVTGGRAHVALKVKQPYGPVVNFSVVKTPDGWRIDDSDGVPSGN